MSSASGDLFHEGSSHLEMPIEVHLEAAAVRLLGSEWFQSFWEPIHNPLGPLRGALAQGNVSENQAYYVSMRRVQVVELLDRCVDVARLLEAAPTPTNRDNSLVLRRAAWALEDALHQG